MNRIARPWKPLACCIATLCHLALPLSMSTVMLPHEVSAQQPENSDPEIENPLLQSDNTTKKLEAKIPIGKTLLIPIAASDADGDPLSYTVTSSNPKVMVRARTGRPKLEIEVAYAGEPGNSETSTPAYAAFSGKMEFQLFRDWTPVTAGFIGGFAQSLFYSPNGSKNTIFHRVIKDFMVQGGDPNGQIPDPTSGPGPERGPGFTFDSEYDIPLLFTGRGQLAMANAGQTSSYKGTNGSQFFITTSSPRYLDVKHTIFGQMVRGWELLEKMQNVPLKAQPSSTDVTRPTQDIKITSTAVKADYQNAVLVLSANGKVSGKVTITVTVKDSKGATATTDFEVETVADEYNTPPIFTQLPESQGVPLGRVSVLPVKAVDLEQDYFIYENVVFPRPSSSVPKRADSNQGGNPMLVLPTSKLSDLGPITLGFWMRPLVMSQNNFEFAESEFNQAGQRDRRSVNLGADDHTLQTQAVPVSGTPGTALTNVPVATYVDTDPRGQAGNVSASINWGDGRPATSGTISRDTSSSSVSAFKITGSHNDATGYARPGVYSVATTITSSKGLRQVVYSTAVITESPVRVFGETYEIKGKTFSSRPLAMITDSDGTAAPGNYEVTLNWGDGTSEPGEVRQTFDGKLYVTGKHTYRDPEKFSVAIRVHKNGTDANNDAVGWATLSMTGFESSEPHLPPFPMAHIVGLINPVPNAAGTQYKPYKATVGKGANARTAFSLALSLLNNGDKKANPSKVRFYLSTDKHLNLENETYTDNSVTPPVERTNPKDIPLTIGKTMKELKLIALKPGQGGGIAFDLTSGQDSRVFAPKNENGSGMYLLANFDYDDPLAKHLPIDHEIALDLGSPYSGTSAIEVTEYAGDKHSASFDIFFDRKPTHEVKIPLTIVNSIGLADATEIYFNAAPPVPPSNQPNLPSDENLVSSPDYTVTFTPDEWAQGVRKKTIQVTGKQDNTKDNDQMMYVQMGPADSLDARYHGRSGANEIRVINRDRDSLIVVSPASLTTYEAAGSGHVQTFTVRLNQKPTSDVILPVVNGDDTEGVLTAQTPGGAPAFEPIDGKQCLRFTPTENYPATRVVTVTAQDDNQTDGNIDYVITIGPSTSNDPSFAGINPTDVSVKNMDNPPTGGGEN